MSVQNSFFWADSSGSQSKKLITFRSGVQVPLRLPTICQRVKNVLRDFHVESLLMELKEAYPLESIVYLALRLGYIIQKNSRFGFEVSRK